MSRERLCAHCGHGFPSSQQLCPHCARPALYGNVFAAEDPEEADALQRRYDEAKREAAARGAGALNVLEDFEAEVANARAVIARPVGELQRLSIGDNEIYATFYDLLRAGVRLPTGDKWDRLRRVTDEALFPDYKERIRFAALSLDGAGPPNYGDCFIVLRTGMIAHRASMFEENSILFMEHHDIKVSKAHELPLGYRATWENRGRLCVAKLANRIDDATPRGAYSGILLQPGSASEDDDFVEVHVWGPMTIRTVERVIFNKPTSRAAREITSRANKQRMAKFGVTLG